MGDVGRTDRALETILVERRGDVLVITLNRPERLNAWNQLMARELAETIVDAGSDGTIGSIVVTGSGRAFCAGADMDMLAERRARRMAGDPEPVGHGGTPEGIDWVQLCRRAVPLVAAVNGVTVGVGLTMILPFDVIVASDVARFGIGLT
jgi:enoyl-CoA hydratase/carnithine racemase